MCVLFIGDFFFKKKKLSCHLPALTINPSEITLSSVQRDEMNLNILMIIKDLTLLELLKIKFMPYADNFHL